MRSEKVSIGTDCFKESPPETQKFQRVGGNTSRCSTNLSKRILNDPILPLKPTKRKARHPPSTAAAHPVVGKASDSGSERMATQSISTKIKGYRVPQDVCCITTPLGKGDTTLSRCIPLVFQNYFFFTITLFAMPHIGRFVLIAFSLGLGINQLLDQSRQ